MTELKEYDYAIIGSGILERMLQVPETVRKTVKVID